MILYFVVIAPSLCFVSQQNFVCWAMPRALLQRQIDQHMNRKGVLIQYVMQIVTLHVCFCTHSTVDQKIQQSEKKLT